MKPSYLIILLLMNFFWAGVYSAYKILGQILPTGSIVTLRFGLAALFLLFTWPWLPGPTPAGRDFVKTVVMGILVFVVGQRLQVYGNELGTAGNSSVLMAIEPLVTSVAAALFLGEHIGPRRWIGFALGMVGVCLLNGAWRPDFQLAGLSGSLIFISSFICEAVYSVVGKGIVAHADVLKTLTIALVVGTIGNLLIDGGTTYSKARLLGPEGWLLLVGLALICTAFGYAFWFIVIRDCPVSVAALTIFSQAIFGVGIAAIWVGEKLHWGQVLGTATIVVGLAVGLSRQIERQVAQRKSDP